MKKNLSPFRFLIMSVLGGLLLSSCDTSTILGSQLQKKPPPTSRAIVSSKNIVIQAPAGFCIDETVSNISSKPTFILFGNCAAISQSNSITQSKVYAVLTATVSKMKFGQIPLESKNLDDYFRSEDGRAILSVNGNPNDIVVLDSFKMDSSYFVLVKNTGQKKSNAISDFSWRAYLKISGHIIAVAIIGFDQKPMQHDESLKIIRHFVNEIRINNGFNPTKVPIG